MCRRQRAEGSFCDVGEFVLVYVPTSAHPREVLARSRKSRAATGTAAIAGHSPSGPSPPQCYLNAPPYAHSSTRMAALAPQTAPPGNVSFNSGNNSPEVRGFDMR